MEQKIKEFKNQTQEVLANEIKTHQHDDHHHENESCCGDCKGQGSCTKMTFVSFGETTSE